MQTSKPISTISFNSESFLIERLDNLIQDGTLSFYCYIKHKGEPTESNDTPKDHFHIYMEPNKRIDTMNLCKIFDEVDKNHVKPLGVLPCQSSKFGDWYLYGLHDAVYLASKGMTRKYHYVKEDMITSNEDYLTAKVNEIKEFNYYYEINNYMEKGFTFEQYIIMKNIHPSQIRAYEGAWCTVQKMKFKTIYKEKEASAGNTC